MEIQNQSFLQFNSFFLLLFHLSFFLPLFFYLLLLNLLLFLSRQVWLLDFFFLFFNLFHSLCLSFKASTWLTLTLLYHLFLSLCKKHFFNLTQSNFNSISLLHIETIYQILLNITHCPLTNKTILGSQTW